MCEAAMRRLDLRRFIQRPHSTGACCRGMRCHASVHKYVLASMCDKSDRMSSKFLDETRCHSICRIMIGRVGPIQCGCDCFTRDFLFSGATVTCLDNALNLRQLHLSTHLGSSCFEVGALQ
ncbi:uncharacterized protein [Physcomitrium patens]|uniref:uncharacterized protein isoform X3 n=1 Tax=Physcomitrium patens TaxID=3218 RepID=UPI003CCE42B5